MLRGRRHSKQNTAANQTFPTAAALHLLLYNFLTDKMDGVAFIVKQSNKMQCVCHFLQKKDFMVSRSVRSGVSGSNPTRKNSQTSYYIRSWRWQVAHNSLARQPTHGLMQKVQHGLDS